MFVNKLSKMHFFFFVKPGGSDATLSVYFPTRCQSVGKTYLISAFRRFRKLRYRSFHLVREITICHVRKIPRVGSIKLPEGPQNISYLEAAKLKQRRSREIRFSADCGPIFSLWKQLFQKNQWF